MDFRLPQPLKYSLKKKKGRRKMQRKETGKLSLKNHNKNVSCQTDSSESSEPSVGSGSKRISRNSTGRKSKEKMSVPNGDIPSRLEKFEHQLNKARSSIYHYCTPSRKDVEDNSRTKIDQGPHLTPVDGCGRMSVTSEVIMSPDDEVAPFNPSSDSDSDSVSVCGDTLRGDDCQSGRISESPSIQSDGSRVLLESSLNSQGSAIVPSATEKVDNLKRFDSKSVRKNLPLVRSSVLHKKFNRAVENDLAIACSSSEFYIRVKNRVLGLHSSKSTVIYEEKMTDSLEKSIRGSRDIFPDIDEFFEGDKENVDENQPRVGLWSNLGETIVRRTMIVPDSDDDSYDSHPPNMVNVAKELNCSKSPKMSAHDSKNKSVVILESSASTLQDSDVRNLDPVGEEESSSIGSDVVRLPKIKKKVVISDSEHSRESDSPKGIGHIIDSSGSDSSVIKFNSDASDEVDQSCIEEIEDDDKKAHSEERSQSRKALWSSDNGEHKAGINGLSPKTKEECIILESAVAVDVKNKFCGVQGYSDINMQFKPGFSTLSQSKHEDIKKWLNAIPCHPDMDGTKLYPVEVHNKSELISKDGDDDNVSLTEMEKVLDELYGKDWGDKNKPLIIKGPRKKESQIICQRLTDSDDSPTPPLPASTPKRKLYNPNNRLLTPKEIHYDTPSRGKNIFTPLSTVGKKGGNKTHKTPGTAGPKYARSQDCLNSGSISSPILKFLSSLSVDHQSARCHPEAKYYVKNFKSKKTELSQKLFNMFNKDVFDSKLPHDLPIIWNNRLRKTAGYCYNRRVKNSEGGFTRTSRVELSSKIVDNAARLRDTLIHELCHAATWIISEVTGGHGPSWKRWTNKAMLVFPELPPISRCHNYDIVTKYRYQCTVCNYSIGRHSKSLDTQRKCCGICGGTFELFLNAKDDAGKPVPKTPRTPNAFALFVKENYKVVKSTQDKLQHKDVMKLLSEKFAQAKISSIPTEK